VSLLDFLIFCYATESGMISVCILAKNSSATIAKALESTRSFQEVIVLDNGSTDETIQIARTFPNVVVYETTFTGFGPLRNEAASLASNDWILALDTDEWLSPTLLEEIHGLQLSPNTVYSMPRDNYYNGKHIKGCGWHPDRVTRLYHRNRTKYSNAEVHESVISDHLQVHYLKSALGHIPFRKTCDFLAKMQNYSSLYAIQHGKKQRSSVAKAFFHSLFAFLRSYFWQRGFLLGAEGFIISLYNSNTVFYKYLKLWEDVPNVFQNLTATVRQSPGDRRS
jgi:glycosyltransferase involved in cell wall biosynthesis